MAQNPISVLDRRSFLGSVVPACSLACLSGGGLAAFAGDDKPSTAGLHKFDVPQEMEMTPRQQTFRQNASTIHLIKTLQGQLDEKELIRLLNLDSASVGREIGERQAKASPDTSFATYTNVFRGPVYDNLLTLEIVEDTEKVFELKVTECLLASVYRQAGLGGEIGHAAVCNMDYHWPPAFNKDFKMERSKTLMQGHEYCNHRYIDTT